MPDVVLITMPWDILASPSPALGIVHELLRQGGVDVETRSLKLGWMDYVIHHQRRKRDPIDITDYEEIASAGSGAGDWIFAEPPMATPERIAKYLTALRTTGVAWIGKAIEMRRLARRFLDQCAAELLAKRPRVVGFTTTFAQNMSSLALARRLKSADPSIRIVFGGANCEGPMGPALQRCFPWVDVVVRGESENIVPELFRALLGGEPPPRLAGLCFFDGGQQVVLPLAGGEPVAMDAVPVPNYDDYFADLARCSFDDTLRTAVFLSFESARGCWWGEVSHCTFCGLNGASMTFRSKSPARVMEEIVGLARRHGVLDLHAVDNIIDQSYFTELMPALAAAGLDLALFYEVKSNLKKHQVDLLRQAGVREIQPGIESLSTPILKLMGKGVTAWQNLRLIKWCAHQKIALQWNLLYGFPREPEDEYRRMAELMPSLWHLPPPLAQPVCVHRFSPYHERPDELGIEIIGPAWYYQFLYDVDAASLMDLAYEFDFRYHDGRVPENYAREFVDAAKAWTAAHAAGASLVYRRGPGFILIRDGRNGEDIAELTLEGSEANVYLACDDGARLETICERAGIDRAGALRILEELVAARLVAREDDRYLGLALPASAPSATRAALVAEPRKSEAPLGELVPIDRLRVSGRASGPC